MEASSAAKASIHADAVDSASPGHQQSSIVVNDLETSEDGAMKNTWLNANDSHHLSLTATMSPMSSLTTESSRNALPTEAITRPLRLLDLPVDILKDIIKEVTHTNDLTSLALCHSALHRLVIPHIYSRFDIVWPDSVTPAEPRTGVDALTYGLATLVMAEDVFGEPRVTQTRQAESNASANKHALDAKVRRRRGNYYAHFTRKFSLGNGPHEWVQEYLISKEGGKMLGTLVALAVARMRNLESFIWDMPTGILRDIWIALSSLDDRNDDLPCRLERIAVRFHDNSPEPHALPLHHPQPPGSHHPALDHVEHPSFSVLPPLKSLSVLDVDELQYLDEMSVLIGRSQSKLRELRVGIARHLERDWTTVWDGDQLQQVDKLHPTAGSVTIGEKRLGGVLGVLTAWVSDMRRTYALPHRPKRLRRRSNATIATAQHSPHFEHSPDAVTQVEMPIDPPDPHPGPAQPHLVPSTTVPPITPMEGREPQNVENDSNERKSSSSSIEAVPAITDPTTSDRTSSPKALQPLNTTSAHVITPNDEEDSRLSGKLALEILELERVPLSIPVLQNVIDWGVLTSLTLLQCPNHEHLWKTLKRLYSPTTSNSRHYATTDPSKSKQRSPKLPVSQADFKLRLTKIHTDSVSPSLISFIKETLAPNSLEVIFLQDACPDGTVVSIDSIFRGILRKHRSSLKKILIDSSERGAGGQPLANSRSKRWMLTHEMLAFITSGKMKVLRELGATLDYRDWHYFLQHLPAIPHLRSLYIPYMVNYVHGSFITEPRELALQLVDIVALRPAIELCYIGIAQKCFEILENLPGKEHDGNNAIPNHMTGDEDDDADDDDPDDDDDDGMPDDDDDDDQSQHSSADSTEFANSDTEDESDGSGGAKARRSKEVQLSLREILYYDDKVGIFKARHGKL